MECRQGIFLHSLTSCDLENGIKVTKILSTLMHLQIIYLCTMVLGKLPVPGRPTIWMMVGQGPIAFAVDAGGGCLDFFLLSSIFSLLFLPLSGRRPDMD